MYDFPELTVNPAVEWTEDERCLLSFTTPVLGAFSLAGRKALYLVCVKVSQAHFLDGVFGADSSPKGCWRVLHKCPIDKRTADLQWRIVHGAIATNRHRVHLDPSVGEGCLFCPQIKSFFHLFVQCAWLAKLAIWKTRKNQMLGQGAVDVVAVFLGLVATRLRTEHAYYNMVEKLPEFMSIWGVNEVLCTVDDVGNLQLIF
ncbi:hypothetical protein MHYP_G00224830 [Metynnis hypsauchen]